MQELKGPQIKAKELKNNKKIDVNESDSGSEDSSDDETNQVNVSVKTTTSPAVSLSSAAASTSSAVTGSLDSTVKVESRHGKPWTLEEEVKMLAYAAENKPRVTIGEDMGRTTVSITSRLQGIAMRMSSKGVSDDEIKTKLNLSESEVNEARLRYKDTFPPEPRSEKTPFVRNLVQTPTDSASVSAKDQLISLHQKVDRLETSINEIRALILSLSVKSS